jgi:hypothetical protein
MSVLRAALASVALAAGLAASFPAHAGPALNQPIPAGALIEEFSGWHGAVNGKSVLGGLGTFSGTGTVYREGHGESSLQGASQAAGYYLVPGLSAQPFSATGNWLNFGANQQATLSFNTPQSWIGFLWGSVDGYNFVEIVDAGQVVSYRGGNGGLASGQVAGGSGDRFAEQFFAYGGSSITSIRFRATGNAFEIDRLATVSAVPEPGTAVLVLAGLAAVGFIARRRTGR